MPRILLVDDEQQVLDALRDRLFRLRKKCQMRFVRGGQAALDALAAEPFDVLVTDLRMPHIDGFAVLEHAARVCPQTIRVVLSGGTDVDLPLRIADYAHQSLAKPAPPGGLELVLERAFAIRSLVTDAATQAALGSVRDFPRDPLALRRLHGALGGGGVDPLAVAQVIESDVSLTATTLRLVNSTMLGDAQPMTSVLQAISRLGLDRLARLLDYTRDQHVSSFDESLVASINAHGLLVSEVSIRTAPQNARRDSFTAGLLHDVGWLVSHPSPALTTSLVAGASPESHPDVRAEAQRLAAASAYLLGLWGLPLHVVEAVAGLHRSDAVGTLRRTLACAHHAVDDAIAAGTDYERIADVASAGIDARGDRCLTNE